MLYKIVDENGEVQADLNIGERSLPQLLERLMSITSLADIAQYTPAEVTLMAQLQLLAQHSRDEPEMAAVNTEAMCNIAHTLADIKCRH